MSPAGALVLAVTALVLLGAVAAWLINVPLWAITALIVVVGLLARTAFHRLSGGRARQDTETTKTDA